MLFVCTDGAKKARLNDGCVTVSGGDAQFIKKPIAMATKFQACVCAKKTSRFFEREPRKMESV